MSFENLNFLWDSRFPKCKRFLQFIKPAFGFSLSTSKQQAFTNLLKVTCSKIYEQNLQEAQIIYKSFLEFSELSDLI